MSSSFSDVIKRFSQLQVLVLGDAKDSPGGAANVAMNVSALGAQIYLLSVVAEGSDTDLMLDKLQQNDVSVEGVVRDPKRRKIASQTVVASSQLLDRFYQGSVEPIDSGCEQELVGALEKLYRSCDAIIVSDYCCGTVTPRIIEKIKELQTLYSRVLIVDSKRLDLYRELGVTAVKPSYAQTMRLLGLEELPADGRAEKLIEFSDSLLTKTGAKIAAVTFDTEGAILFERGSTPYRTYSKPAPNTKATGAGDTFIASLSLALASGADVTTAAEVASAAAAIVVDKEGTAQCTQQELQEYFLPEGKLITDPARLLARIELYRQQGLKIAFTNGCFDILHRGHITYLSRAKSLGDILIVAVNADESIARLKGSGRPINQLEDRLQVLSALSCVDLLLPFSEDTPSSLIELIKPDLFVKGGDYTRETLPEADLVERIGGRIEILPYVEDRSTTGIIDRIRKVYFKAASPELAVNTQAILSRPEKWKNARNILCVRLDTLGDVLMTSPAMRALKVADPDRRITLLTSARGAPAAKLIAEIDRVIVYDSPWMKATEARENAALDFEMIERLRSERFDAAVIFNVYSQNPLPAALFCYLAEVPLRLAHCHENPYQVLTDWIQDTEPHSGIRHEVQRQIDLVAAVGYRTNDQRISVNIPPQARTRVSGILQALGGYEEQPLIVIHAGATAPSRRYPGEGFARIARELANNAGCRIVFTGTEPEREMIERIRLEMNARSESLLGLDITEFAALISMADLLLSNNTSAVHIAAGTGTPVVDLYALTNPQHIPWQVPNRVLYHDVPCKYCYSSNCPEKHHDCLRKVTPEDVVQAVVNLLAEDGERESVRPHLAGVSV